MVTNPDNDKRDDLLQKSDMNNQKFEKYYRRQLEMDDNDWRALLDTCREPLPSTFRICGSREYVCLQFGNSCFRFMTSFLRTASVLTSVVEKTYIPHLTGVVFEDQPIPPPLALPW
jgi:multisite-specific tRNA:(cytosine-C5)-methyltransferase